MEPEDGRVVASMAEELEKLSGRISGPGAVAFEATLTGSASEMEPSVGSEEVSRSQVTRQPEAHPFCDLGLSVHIRDGIL